MTRCSLWVPATFPFPLSLPRSPTSALTAFAPLLTSKLHALRSSERFRPLKRFSCRSPLPAISSARTMTNSQPKNFGKSTTPKRDGVSTRASRWKTGAMRCPMKTPVSDIGTGSKRVSHTLKTRKNLLKMFPGQELATTLRHAGLSAGSACRSTPSTAKSAPKSSALSQDEGEKTEDVEEREQNT